MQLGDFQAMEKSFLEATRSMHWNTSIAVALYRLRALMLAYRWALDHGYRDPLVDPEDKPCVTCQEKHGSS